MCDVRRPSSNSSPVKTSESAFSRRSPLSHRLVEERTLTRTPETPPTLVGNMVCDNSQSPKVTNFSEGVCLTSTPMFGRTSRCSSQSASTTASDTVSTPDLDNGLSDCGIPEMGGYNRLGHDDMIHPEYNVPIVGYEVMEERARFTVFRIHVENVRTRHSWFVFRRYTDFVRLNRKVIIFNTFTRENLSWNTINKYDLRSLFPGLRFALPPKRWFGNNFDPVFLEDRLLGLQAFINNIISHKDISHSEPVRDFFCLDDPPDPHDSIEESRALCESLEDTVHRLQEELKEKDSQLQLLMAEVAMLRSQQETLLKSLKLECTLTAHALNPKHPITSPSKDQDISSQSLTENNKDPVDTQLFHMHSLNLALAHMVERTMSEAESATNINGTNACSVDELGHSRFRLHDRCETAACCQNPSGPYMRSKNNSNEDLLERSTGDGCIWAGERPTPLGGAGSTPPSTEAQETKEISCNGVDSTHTKCDIADTEAKLMPTVSQSSVPKVVNSQ